MMSLIGHGRCVLINIGEMEEMTLTMTSVTRALTDLHSNPALDRWQAGTEAKACRVPIRLAWTQRARRICPEVRLQEEQRRIVSLQAPSPGIVEADYILKCMACGQSCQSVGGRVLVLSTPLHCSLPLLVHLKDEEDENVVQDSLKSKL
jgi:hypothetical protein